MTFTQSIRSVYSKYATFEGRASRSEYWWFYLFYALVYLALYIPIVAVLASSGEQVSAGAGIFMAIAGVALLVFALGSLIPMISVLVRRLHDTGRSGWWYWIGLVPFIGGIWLLVLLILESTPGENRYGPQP